MARFRVLAGAPNTRLSEQNENVPPGNVIASSAPNTWLSELSKHGDNIATSTNELAELMKVQSSQSPSLRVDCDLDGTISR